MKSRLVTTAGLLAAVLAGCDSSLPSNVTSQQSKAVQKVSLSEETCEGEPSWLTQTSSPDSSAIPDESTDCAFYRSAWQNFLVATGPTGGGTSFLSYPTISDLFGASAAPLFPAAKAGSLSAAIRVAKAPNEISAGGSGTFGSGVRQASDVRGILADDRGRPIYYSIHVNQGFAAFIRSNNLTTGRALRAASETLAFPGGVAEFKAAWQIVDQDHPGTGFITTKARVPRLKRVADDLSIDTTNLQEVTLRLIALHVAFTVANHPEMIWATFEHTDANGLTDVAPSASSNPNGSTPSVNAGRPFILYPQGSAAASANQPATVADFDEARQHFARATPVFRVFPASKTTETTEDDSVVSINASVRNLLQKRSAGDNRARYRLVGAVWLKHPLPHNGQPGSFVLNGHFSNPAGQSSDDPAATLSGEAALSSTAMESFTQTDFVNCFSCHNTHHVTRDAPPGETLIEPKLLNVSHVLSRFLSEAPEEKK
jgi:hypothetical protein